MSTAAIYARYSTSQQRETSIDDQVRRCRALAVEHGCDVPDSHVYSDSELSGTRKHTEKRAGYQQLLSDLKSGKIDTLVVDEWGRLSRDKLEQAQLERLVEDTGVRVIGADGIDTSRPGWQLLVGVKGIVSAQEIRDTQHRVTRGMLGQLERGYMIACPPFGYRLKRDIDAAGNHHGTHWEISEPEADLVREAFRRRSEGEPHAAIARWLNELGIPTPRKPRKETGGYWRPGTLVQLLRNTIYRGVFIWNGSPFARAKAKKKRILPDTKEFKRESLRLVSDELWNAVNVARVSRTGYGGGKHLYAGLMSCGICGATLTVKQGKGEEPAVYCAQCLQGRLVGGRQSKTGYVSASGLRVLLAAILADLVSEPVRAVFRARLTARLLESPEAAMASVQSRLDGLRRGKARLLRVLTQAEADDPDVERELREMRSKIRGAEQELSDLKARGKASEALDKHLTVDASDYVGRLLDGSLPPEKLRAVLHRLLPEFELLGKPSRYVSEFRVRLAPGVAVAAVLETEPVDDIGVELHYRLSTAALRPVSWAVERYTPVSPNNTAPAEAPPVRVATAASEPDAALSTVDQE